MARALFGLGGIAAHRGDYVLARDQFREGLALERDEASLPDVAEALAAVARIESILGEPLPSREHFEQARVIQRRLDDPWESAFVLHALAEQARDEQDLERAQALEDEAFAQWTRSGSRMGQRSALMNLAVLAFDRGDLGRACELAQRALELCQEVGDDGALCRDRFGDSAGVWRVDGGGAAGGRG
jgi:tetratricopeptide (TPR) repeat protein